MKGPSRLSFPYRFALSLVFMLLAALTASAQKIPKTELCHNGNTITVDKQAVLNAHLDHGDQLGPCNNLNIEPGYPPVAKSTEVVSVELESLSQNFGNGQTPNPLVYQITPDNLSVLVEIVVLQGQLSSVQQLLSDTYGILPGDYVNLTPNQLVITAYFEISKVTELNNYPLLINEVRAVSRPVRNIGAVDSEGDAIQGSLLARAAYQLEGAGIKIGILSDSYNALGGAAQDIASGDLPGDGNPNDYTQEVEVLQDAVGVDEGRAMMHIVHDIAPGASLAFRTGFRGAGDFAQGIRELVAAGCNAIVDDITYYGQDYFGDGLVAQTVNDVVNNDDVVYITSAGNFSNLSSEGVFTNLSVNGENVHNLGGGDYLQSFTAAPGRWVIVLQWQNPVYSETASGTNVDLDISLALDNGTSFIQLSKDNTGLDPVEILPFTITGTEPQTTNIKIVNASGTESVPFKYVVYGGLDFTFNDAVGNSYKSTITGQANASGAITVGAVTDGNPGDGIFQPVVETFSSTGGTNGVTKPDIVAPNRVSTGVEGFAVFAGTSASAPHVAGAAALLLQAKATYSLDFDVKTQLMSTADPVPGSIYEKGAGFMRVDNALAGLTETIPQISGITLPADVSPETELTTGVEITIVLEGNYLNDEAVVLLRDGEELVETARTTDGVTTTLTVLIEPEVDATTGAVIPTILGNPSIRIENPGTGGSLSQYSETLQLFDVITEDIYVRAVDQEKFYGELVPDNVFTLEDINGNDPVVPASVVAILESLLGYNMPDVESPDGQVNSLSNVNIYAIIPFFTSDLPVELTEVYNFIIDEYSDAALTVNKIDLTITPEAPPEGFVYGDPITGFIYQYLLGTAGQEYNFGEGAQQQIIQNVSDEHNAGVLNGTALVNAPAGFRNGTALVNIDGDQLAAFRNGTALVNFNFIITEAALEAALGNGTALVNVPAGPLFNNTQLNEGAAIGNGTALVNLPSLLNGTALVNFPAGDAGRLRNGTALVNMPGLRNGTALVNSPGGLTNGTALVNIPAFRNAEGGVDVAYANTILIFADEDNEPVPEGQDPPVINLYSLNWITGNGVGANYAVSGNYDSKNFNIIYKAGEFTVTPAALDLTINQPEPIFYGDPQPEYTYSFEGFVYDETELTVFLEGISFTLDRDLGDAGTYDITPVYTNPDNYTLTSNQVSLTVNKAPLTVAANSIPTGVVSYGSAQPIYTSTIGEFQYDDDENSVFPDPSGSPDISGLVYTLDKPYNQAGEYGITVSYSGEVKNYDVTFVPGTMVVDKADLTLIVDNKAIRFGEPLPNFTHTLVGNVNGETDAVIFNGVTPSYSVPLYNDEGIFIIELESRDAQNYTVSIVEGELVVNPPKNGTKKLQPYLDCVQDNPGGGLPYIANFSVDNRNNFEMYIPLGERNRITGGLWSGTLPTAFQPGITSFSVEFDGNAIDYFLISGSGNQSGSTGSTASLGSNKCGTNARTDGSGVGVQSASELLSAAQIQGFPNPTRDNFLIKLEKSILSSGDLTVLDGKGRYYNIKTVRNVSDNTIEMDFSGLNSGIYFIKLNLDDTYKVIRVIKQ